MPAVTSAVAAKTTITNQPNGTSCIQSMARAYGVCLAYEAHLQCGRTDLAGAAEQSEDARDVCARLRVGRDAAAGGHGAQAGVVGGQGEWHGAEAAEEIAHQARLGVNCLPGIEGVGQA